MMNNPRLERPSRRSPFSLNRGSAGHSHVAPSPAAVRSSTVASFVTDEARFLAALPVIDDVTAKVCRRHHVSGAEADDFRSDVRMHFIERNYEVLRRFEGRCQLSTYLNVVIQRLFVDRRNREWGRWRPSAEARRLGPTGILLDRLITRDGWSHDHALESIVVNHGVTIDDDLLALCDKLAARGPVRRSVPEDDAGEIVDHGPGADDNVVRAEQDFVARRVRAALERALQSLTAIDRLILKMRFEDRVSVADIARALSLDQRRLYRTIEGLLETIGTSLRAEGISAHDIEEIFADGGTLGLRDEPATDVSGPTLASPAVKKGIL